MERRLVKHGPASTIVSLPAAWVREQGLKAGDAVEVQPDGDRLMILKKSTGALNETTLILTGLNRTSIMHLIRSAYREGYHKITIKSEDKMVPHYRSKKEVALSQVVREEINRLIGLEIVEQRASTTVVQQVTAPAGQEVPGIFRKIFTMTRLLISHIGETESEEEIGVEERHDTITKLISYAIRLINTGEAGFTSQERARTLHALMLMDIIVDTLKYYERDNSKLKQEFTQGLVELFAEVEKVIFARDIKALNNFEKKKQELRHKPLDRMLPITDILTDLIVMYASAIPKAYAKTQQ